MCDDWQWGSWQKGSFGGVSIDGKEEEHVLINEDSEIIEWEWMGEVKGKAPKAEYSLMRFDFEERINNTYSEI